jgi:hypothetical protein
MSHDAHGQTTVAVNMTDFCFVYFQFDQAYYKQTKGLTTGAPTSPN